MEHAFPAIFGHKSAADDLLDPAAFWVNFVQNTSYSS